MNMWQYVGAWLVKQARQINTRQVFIIQPKIIGVNFVEQQDISG